MASNLNARVKSLESAAPHVAAMAALPMHLRPLARGENSVIAYQLADKREWFTWPPGPFKYEHVYFVEPETVPEGAIGLSGRDIAALEAAGCMVVRVEFVDNWSEDAKAIERETEQA